MSETEEHVSKKRVVYDVPAMDAVTVRRDLPYGPYGDDRALDLYRPADASSGETCPAVVIVAGYPDPGFVRAVGCPFKETGSSISWARLLAASGLAAVTYSNREPVGDARNLLRYLRESAPSLGIDAMRIGLWASSGSVPLALSMLMEEANEDALKCAVLCYGYTLDGEGSSIVADAAAQWGFVHPAAGRWVDDLPQVPLFFARAGRDECPGLNQALDRFLGEALKWNLPLTLVNHPEAPHAFDLFHDSERTREIVREILAFARFHLSVPSASSPRNGTSK